MREFPSDPEKRQVLSESEGGGELPDFLRERTDILDPDMTFVLANERDANGRPIEGKALWLSLQQEGRHAEGKLYEPPSGGGKNLVVFEPGMPGDSTTWMEERHVPKLLEAGYTVFVLRHLGTRTDVDGADRYLHCPERARKGKATDRTAIGEQRQYFLDEVAGESATAMNTLGDQFDHIAVIGHSAGALYEAYALASVREETRAKVTNFVALAGFLGDFQERKEAFGDVGSYYAWCQRYVALGDSAENVKRTQRMFGAIAHHGIPEHVMVTLVNAPEDEFLTLAGAEKFQQSLGRGLRIIDRTQEEPDFHDLKNLQPSTLLRLIAMRYPKSRHTATVRRQKTS